MTSYAIDQHGELHRFGNPEDTKEYLEREGLAYVMFDHWPTEDEYYEARESMNNGPVDEEYTGDVICNRAYHRTDCNRCLHRTPHKPFDEICGEESKCKMTGARVRCLPC